MLAKIEEEVQREADADVLPQIEVLMLHGTAPWPKKALKSNGEIFDTFKRAQIIEKAIEYSNLSPVRVPPRLRPPAHIARHRGPEAAF
jgi:hypothetical protein